MSQESELMGKAEIGLSDKKESRKHTTPEGGGGVSFHSIHKSETNFILLGNG